MRYYLTCFLLFFVSTFLMAQKKKDNTVIVNGFVTYSKIKEQLFKEGFVPINPDTSFIMTSNKAIGWIGEVNYLIQRTDSSVIFKGNVIAEIDGTSTGKMPLENVGSKESVYRAGFSLMCKLAKSFGWSLTFLRQE